MNLVISFRVGRWQFQIGRRERFNGLALDHVCFGRFFRIVSWEPEPRAEQNCHL